MLNGSSFFNFSENKVLTNILPSSTSIAPFKFENPLGAGPVPSPSSNCSNMKGGKRSKKKTKKCKTKRRIRKRGSRRK